MLASWALVNTCMNAMQRGVPLSKWLQQDRRIFSSVHDAPTHCGAHGNPPWLWLGKPGTASRQHHVVEGGHDAMVLCEHQHSTSNRCALMSTPHCSSQHSAVCLTTAQQVLRMLFSGWVLFKSYFAVLYTGVTLASRHLGSPVRASLCCPSAPEILCVHSQEVV